MWHGIRIAWKTERGEVHRAIFIGNNDAEALPESRESPFGDGWRKQTKLHKVTALTTQTPVSGLLREGRGKTENRGVLGVVLFHRRDLRNKGPVAANIASHCRLPMANRIHRLNKIIGDRSLRRKKPVRFADNFPSPAHNVSIGRPRLSCGSLPPPRCIECAIFRRTCPDFRA